MAPKNKKPRKRLTIREKEKLEAARAVKAARREARRLAEYKKLRAALDCAIDDGVCTWDGTVNNNPPGLVDLGDNDSDDSDYLDTDDKTDSDVSDDDYAEIMPHEVLAAAEQAMTEELATIAKPLTVNEALMDTASGMSSKDWKKATAKRSLGYNGQSA